MVIQRCAALTHWIVEQHHVIPLDTVEGEVCKVIMLVERFSCTFWSGNNLAKAWVKVSAISCMSGHPGDAQ